MSLLDRVTAILDRAGVPYAVIGAAAMATHGVARSTHDIDLLALAGSCLDGALWPPLANAGVSVSVTRGDAADPLAGVVRFEDSGKRPVDLVVGRHGGKRARWNAPDRRSSKVRACPPRRPATSSR